MGYRPRKSPFSHLKARNLVYSENDQTFTLISFNRETMLLEVHITDGDEKKNCHRFSVRPLAEKDQARTQSAIIAPLFLGEIYVTIYQCNC